MQDGQNQPDQGELEDGSEYYDEEEEPQVEAEVRNPRKNA